MHHVKERGRRFIHIMVQRLIVDRDEFIHSRIRLRAKYTRRQTTVRVRHQSCMLVFLFLVFLYFDFPRSAQNSELNVQKRCCIYSRWQYQESE